MRKDIEIRKALTLSEVSQICNVDRKTVLNWVHSGKLKASHTLGGHNRILHEDLEKFVQLNRLGVKMPLIDDRKKRIVIIDDDKLWLELQHKNITRNFSNTEVYCFQDGYQAILEVGKLQPDLIILDLVMPYFDGFRFMDALQKIEDIKQPLLLVISAFLDDEKVKRLKSSIASRWLSKTVFKEEFLENIAKLLGKELVERVEAQSEVTAAAV